MLALATGLCCATSRCEPGSIETERNNPANRKVYGTRLDVPTPGGSRNGFALPDGGGLTVTLAWAGERFNRLQAAVLTMSCGPVAPSDGVNNSDVALIMRSCSSNGTLLQPDHPAKAIDAQFSVAIAGAPGARGQVWSSEVRVADTSGGKGTTFSYVLAAMLEHAFELQLWQLGLHLGP